MKRVFLFMMSIMGTVLFTVSCQSNDSQDANEENQFYYYPQKNIYFDVDKKIFFYSLDGGKSWDSVTNAGDREPATLGEKIIVYSADRKVYKDNVSHRKLYNGKLINIIDSDTAFASTLPEVAERKVQKKKTDDEKLEEDEPIKGLNKFLNKLFGKHNKKKQEK